MKNFIISTFEALSIFNSYDALSCFLMIIDCKFDGCKQDNNKMKKQNKMNKKSINRYMENSSQQGSWLNPEKQEDTDIHRSHDKFTQHRKSSSNTHNRISYQLGKIISKNVTREKQCVNQQNFKLRQQNFKLRQLNKKLRDNLQNHQQKVTKLTTRLNVCEKEKDRIVTQCNNQSKLLPIYKHKYKKSMNNDKYDNDINLFPSLKGEIQFKKIIRKNYDEILELKNKNNLLKRSIKYTEIRELNVQIQHITNQCKRVCQILQQRTRNYMKTIENYENTIKKMKYQLTVEISKNSSLIQSSKKEKEDIFKLKQHICQIKKRDRKNFGKVKLERINQQSQRCQNCQKLLQYLNEQKKNWQNLQQQFNQYKDNSQNLQQQLNEYKDNCSNLQKQINEYNEKCYNLQQQLNENKEKCNKLQEKCQKLEKQHHDNIENNVQEEISYQLKSTFENTLKQTIKYRLMYYYYNYSRLQKEINDNNVVTFNADIVEMILKSIPFQLDKEQSQYIILYLFGEIGEKTTQSISSQDFLQKIRFFMIDMQQVPQRRRKQLLSSCKIIIQKNRINIVKHFQKLSKSHFVNVLKQFQFNSKQIQILLIEASKVSVSIQDINYQELFQKILKMRQTISQRGP